MSNEQTTPSPSQLSQRLRAMHAARRLHCSTPDTHQPVYSIQATTERLADLMAAADRLEQLQRALDEAELREMGAQSAACHLGALVDEITAERDALEQQLGTQSVAQVQHLPADDTEGGAP